MSFNFNYHSMENFELLLDVSRGWSETYNFIKQMPTTEEWEQRTLDDLLLSEKVFDV
jgi:sensor domain CHASE-containing protein